MEHRKGSVIGMQRKSRRKMSKDRLDFLVDVAYKVASKKAHEEREMLSRNRLILPIKIRELSMETE